MRIRKLIAATAVAGGVLTAGPLTAAPASAAPASIDYDCATGEVCLYYNSEAYGYGAVYVQYDKVPNYQYRYFSSGRNGGSGAGVEVKNHAAAVDSWISSTFRVYYNSNYNCNVACQDIPGYYTLDLNSRLKNNNASGQNI
ncbi:hypothetical protein [Streptomyces coelicoflavus]|uniref:hypothetical protein n=1 Tax=Streptomyces coelicoflavus TaxID=285562 RepID=UPI001EF2FF99|nr:hypothetical protein [Streptomyces coelicoflavus]